MPNQSDIINMMDHPVSTVVAEADLPMGPADSVIWYVKPVSSPVEGEFSELKLWVFDVGGGPPEGEFVVIYKRVALHLGNENPDTSVLKPDPYWQYEIELPATATALGAATQAAFVAAQTFDPTEPQKWWSNWGYPFWRVDGGFITPFNHHKGAPDEFPLQLYGTSNFQNEAVIRTREQSGQQVSVIYGRQGSTANPAQDAKVNFRDGQGVYRTFENVLYWFNTGIQPSVLLKGPLAARVFETMRLDPDTYGDGLLLEVPEYFGIIPGQDNLADPDDDGNDEVQPTTFTVPVSGVWNLLSAELANLVDKGKLNFTPQQLQDAQDLLAQSDVDVSAFGSAYKAWADYQAALSARRSWLRMKAEHADYLRHWWMWQMERYYREAPNIAEP